MYIYCGQQKRALRPFNVSHPEWLVLFIRIEVIGNGHRATGYSLKDQTFRHNVGKLFLNLLFGWDCYHETVAAFLMLPYFQILLV